MVPIVHMVYIACSATAVQAARYTYLRINRATPTAKGTYKNTHEQPKPLDDFRLFEHCLVQVLMSYDHTTGECAECAKRGGSR